MPPINLYVRGRGVHFIYTNRSERTIEELVSSVGLHLALSIYELAPSFVATRSTLEMIIKADSTKYSMADLGLALDMAVNPSKEWKAAQRTKLVGLGLLNEEGKPARYPRTFNFPKTAPSTANHPFNKGFRLLWLNVAPPFRDLKRPFIGRAIGPEKYGPMSTPSRVVAECGRQLSLGMYKLRSLTATDFDVAVSVKAEDSGGRDMLLYSLLAGGGKPLDEEEEAQAISRGILQLSI
ncbi:MAG: hypothetical protein LQ340_000329 [Diploschistes diacapsis]|nr:MAG: hypothetical protein LQ340_000329 [Diploschistes diacapsis]